MRLRHIAPALGGGIVILACGFGDLFRSPGVGDVVLTYTGADVLNVGARVPIAVTVTVGGTSFPNPRLSVTSSDTTIVALSPNGDTLIAVAQGHDTLTIKYLSSILTDSLPTLLQPVRVNP